MKKFECVTRCYGFLSREWLPGETIELDEEAEQSLPRNHFKEVPMPTSQADMDDVKAENSMLKEQIEALKAQMNDFMSDIREEKRGPGRPKKG